MLPCSRRRQTEDPTCYLRFANRAPPLPLASDGRGPVVFLVRLTAPTAYNPRKIRTRQSRGAAGCGPLPLLPYGRYNKNLLYLKREPRRSIFDSRQVSLTPKSKMRSIFFSILVFLSSVGLWDFFLDRMLAYESTDWRIVLFFGSGCH